jgi:ChrR Cupin-like domain
MQYHVPEKLHADLSKPVVVHTGDQPWTPSPMPGVERRFLERDGGEVARASSIVRYAPGSAFPRHVHDKGEEYLVLRGVFSDEHGDFGKGAYVRNPPGSSHAPFTKEGCTIFVKLRQFLPDDNTTVRIAPGDVAAERTPIAGLSRTILYKSACEIVALEDYAPGIKWTDREGLGGEEILVIEGDLLYGDYLCETGTWLRFPAGTELPISTRSGCRLWTKRGHLELGFEDILQS